MCKEGASLQPNKLEFWKRRHNNEIYKGCDDYYTGAFARAKRA